MFSSNLMNKAPNGNEAGDQTFAIFFKRQRNNFFFITFVCLPGKHWKVQREFLSGYLDNLTGRNKEEIQEVAEISHFTKGGSVGPSRVFSSMLMYCIAPIKHLFFALGNFFVQNYLTKRSPRQFVTQLFVKYFRKDNSEIIGQFNNFSHLRASFSSNNKMF